MFKMGDKLEIIDHRGAKLALGRKGQVGIVVSLGEPVSTPSDRIIHVRMDDGLVIPMCAKRFKLYELPMMQYDPTQQGDTEDDI